MYAFKLALLVLGATAAYAYPAATKNPNSLALVRPEQNLSRTIQDSRALRAKGDEKRQIHNADYQANGPPPSSNPGPAQEASSPAPAKPAPSEPAPKDKRFDTALLRGSSVSSSSRSLEKAGEVDVEKSTADHDEKRQIHNADYQANGPPPSPNPGPAQDSSSPARPPPAAPSSSASQDKRTESSFEDSPGSIMPSPSGSHVDENDVSIKKRSLGDTFAANAFNHRASKLVSSFADREWYGTRRRTVEELTNINNRNFDHDAVTRWSRSEVDKMRAWSKLGRSNMES
ncbi:hypothetical protein B0H12DRAFT_1123296 [Mycena haematopus]|nr:hypothetical protein B0H12DRAFT_1123296 [Mycena haematopus]